jgi:hypothetical protein
MIYKFKSAACGDLIMLGAHGEQLLRLLGRAPSARGIIEPAAMPAALQALRAAIATEDARRAEAAPAGCAPAETGGEESERHAVGLQQRLWPMLEMLQRSHAENAPVTWGV